MFKRIIFLYFILFISANANILQDTIDSAPTGAILKLPSTTYVGNIVIDKPVTLIGKEGTTIEGLGSGNVITIKSSHVKLKHLKIIKSGNRLDALDSAVFIKKATQIEIANCIIADTLFGIFMDNVNDSVIKNNKISSINQSIGHRGDGLRLWFSHNNIIKNNIFTKSRDVVFMRSNANRVINNYMEDCRYAVFAQYTKDNIIKNNEIKRSAVGVFLEGSKDTIVSNNLVQGQLGVASSLGILLKGASNVHVKKNIIGQCNQALYIDTSPMIIDTKNWIIENKIMYSTRGLNFRGKSFENIIKKNELFGNMDNIMSDSYIGKTNKNEIIGNYWDDYEGFDLNKDNIGDSSYKKYIYLDQLWIKNPELRFFYGSPIISMLNFMLKLAPFMEPIFLVEDKKPIYNVSYM